MLTLREKLSRWFPIKVKPGQLMKSGVTYKIIAILESDGEEIHA